MKAMILAAGRGERMRPITDRVPKPLIEAGGESLIERQVRRLVAAGFADIVVNVSYLADAVIAHLGDGARLDARIRFSHEPIALETAGGIAQALPLLQSASFAVVNGDIYSDYDYANLAHALRELERYPQRLAYLVLVDNPEHHPSGDFTLAEDGRVGGAQAGRLTFSGMGAYRASLFDEIAPGGRGQLAPLLYRAAEAGRVYGEHFRGRWLDVGSPERLARLRALLGERPTD